jgi:hypothetical protein
MDTLEQTMKLKAKPAVFTSDRVTSDMLKLTLQAVAVGAAAAITSGLIVAGMVALAA